MEYTKDRGCGAGSVRDISCSLQTKSTETERAQRSEHAIVEGDFFDVFQGFELQITPHVTRGESIHALCR